MSHKAICALVGLILAAGVLRAHTPVTRAAEVRRLRPEEARLEYPVKIHGVVTWSHPEAGELFVQDASAGIFVFIRNSVADGVLRAGSAVDLEGLTAPGDFSSSITRARIHVTGSAGLPDPVRLPFERIMTGEQDSQWGQLEGVVRSGREQGGVLYLNVAAPGGTFLAILQGYAPDWNAKLVDSRVRLNGVLAAAFNDRRQVTGARIFVPEANCLTILEAAPAAPFQLRPTPVAQIGTFRPSEDWSHRVRVHATVTASVTSSLLYVSDAEGSLAVALDGSCGATPGSLVDIIGFPGTVDSRPGLTNAVCRLLRGGAPLRPTEMSAGEIFPASAEALGSGLQIAQGSRNDLKLVTVKGTLLQANRAAKPQTLTMATDDRTFLVTLPDSAGPLTDSLIPGSLLKVTGVCVIAYDEFHRAESFRLLARGVADIAVIARPSWLTLGHALWLIVPMTLLVLAAVGWIGVLRKHVAHKTAALQHANERLRRASIEDPVTGASNRRRFDELLNDELTRTLANRSPLSLAMIDIDHFKAVNDLYGHQRGDQYLARVVEALRWAIEPMPAELVARYGGEEFAVLLPGMDSQSAEELSNRMRLAVFDLAAAHERSVYSGRLTVSIGVASAPAGTAPDPEQLVRLADAALYEAKEAGRNRVVVNAARESQQALKRVLEVVV